MRQEWHTYWYWAFRKTGTLVPALGVSLLFFAARAPEALSRSLPLGPSLAVSLSIGFSIWLWVWIVYCLAWAVLTRIQIQTGRLPAFPLWAHFGIGLSGVVFGLFLSRYLRAWILGEAAPPPSQGWAWLLSGAFVTLTFLFYYAYREAQAENLTLQTANAEARYHALKHQLQPHFLFNSLNSLSELIDSDREAANRMTQRLADLYRGILSSAKRTTAPLSSELALVRDYLELEQVRFGERLQFRLSAPESAQRIHVPTLVLQTLVENGVKHGVAPAGRGGGIEVRVQREQDGWYRAEVLSPGHADVPATRGSGTGLANTRARLDLLYGDRHGFSLGQTPAGDFQAAFRFSGEPIG